MTALDLPFRFSGYWLHAHGEGGGADYDLVMERDRDGLPVLRGRHVAGLLRLALLRAQTWRWLDAMADDDIPRLLLGGPGGEPGCLALGDARVSDTLRAALLRDPALIEGLFARMATTALNEHGVAKARHLRAIEAAAPLTLHARVSWEPEVRTIWAKGDATEAGRIAAAGKHWTAWLDCAWPALDEAGARRTRGFGRLAHVALPGAVA